MVRSEGRVYGLWWQYITIPVPGTRYQVPWPDHRASRVECMVWVGLWGQNNSYITRYVPGTLVRSEGRVVESGSTYNGYITIGATRGGASASTIEVL